MLKQSKHESVLSNRHFATQAINNICSNAMCECTRVRVYTFAVLDCFTGVEPSDCFYSLWNKYLILLRNKMNQICFKFSKPKSHSNKVELKFRAQIFCFSLLYFDETIDFGHFLFQHLRNFGAQQKKIESIDFAAVPIH